jgi:hypothetical protein
MASAKKDVPVVTIGADGHYRVELGPGTWLEWWAVAEGDEHERWFINLVRPKDTEVRVTDYRAPLITTH